MIPFNFNEAINQWIRQLRKHPGFEDSDVIEMEAHIRDYVDHLLIEGYSEEQAFRKAIAEFGETDSIGSNLSLSRRPNTTWARLFSLFPTWFKIFYRSTLKNKFYHTISISSLAFGMAVALVIYKLLAFEFSYDQHFSQHEHIYRLEAKFYQGGEWIASANNSWYAGQVVEENLSGIEEVVRITPGRATLVKGDQEIFEKNLAVTSANFFRVFDFPFVEGDPQTAFNNKASIVLSQSTAMRHFGDQSALGQVLVLKGVDRPVTVTGVMKDIPRNTHFQKDAIINIEGLKDLYNEAFFTNPGWTSCFTYLRLQPKTNIVGLEAQFPRLIETHLASTFSSEDTEFLLRPLAAIHLHSKSGEELSVNGNLGQLKFLGIMASLILLLAILNYLNLSTAGFSTRLREMAIRKTVGASKPQIFTQLLSETTMHFLVSLLFGIVIITLATPVLNNLVPLQVISDYSLLEGFTVLCITLGIALVSGMLPASFFTAQNPNKVLASRTVQLRGKPLLRKTLVTFQFMITVAMLIATVVIYYQYQFIKDYDRGYNVESVLAVPKYNMKAETYQALKAALLKHSNIQAVGASSLIFPGALQSSISYRTQGDNGENRSMKAVRTDNDFFNVFQIQLKEGQRFSKKYNQERPQVILNEKAARLLSWEHPDNHWFEPQHLEHRAEVIGFAQDFNFESLKNEIIPVAFLFDPDNSHIMYLRLGEGNLPSTIEFVKEVFSNFSDNRFEHWFVKDTLTQQFAQERAFTKVFSLFTLIAIIIAFAGLYGLSRFVCERRTKEIGIRKVLGASSMEVLWIILRGFILLALVAYLLVAPIVGLLLNNWLSNFAYHTTLGAKIFLLTLIATLLLSTIAVIYQVLSVSLRNPVNSLRYE